MYENSNSTMSRHVHTEGTKRKWQHNWQVPVTTCCKPDENLVFRSRLDVELKEEKNKIIYHGPGLEPRPLAFHANALPLSYP